jgi:Dolichyl-phosphate-mannose-protein mannosyltransferase
VTDLIDRAHPPPVTPTVRPRRSGRRAELGLVLGLVLASAAVRFVAARGVEVPWIAPDESIYALQGRSLVEDGTLAVLDGPAPYYSALYPAFVGVPLSLEDLAAGVTVLQAMQALLMSLTAAIVYAWTRPLAGRGWSLVAAALSVAIPGLAYSGIVMTEAVVYPLVTVALWTLARLIVRPTLGRQWLFAAVAVVAVLTRMQTLLLLPTAVVAILLAAALGRDRALLRACTPLLGALSAAILGGLLLVATDRSPLGAYTATLEADYDVADVARDVVWHAGDVVLLVAAIPLVALVALAVPAVRGLEEDRRVRAALAVTIAYVPLLVLQVGAFASSFVGHLAERDLLTAVPPLFVVFGIWLGRGIPRPGVATKVAALGVAALAIALPIAELTEREAFLDSFTAIPLRRLAEHTSEGTMQVVFATTVALLAALAALVPRRAAVLLPIAVGAVLVAVTGVASAEIRSLSEADRRWWFAEADPGWVDAAADDGVTYLQAGTTFWGGVWKHAFWNRRIEAVASLPDTPVPGPIGSRLVSIRFDGVIADSAGRPLPSPLAVVPQGFRLHGERLAGFGPSSDQPGLELWRLDPPSRVAIWIRGLESNGDLRGRATVTVYDCRRGALELTLLGKQGLPVDVLVDGERVRRIAVPPNTVWNGAVPVVARDGRRICIVELASPGLVGATRVEYVSR